MQGQEFTDRINDLLKNKNIKKSDFYSELKLSNNASTKWSTGSFPNSQTLFQISQYLGVSMDYLFTGKDNQLDADSIQLIQDFSTLSERDKITVKELIRILKSL